MYHNAFRNMLGKITLILVVISMITMGIAIKSDVYGSSSYNSYSSSYSSSYSNYYNQIKASPLAEQDYTRSGYTTSHLM